MAVDYVEIVDAETLEPVVSLRGTCYVLIAAVVGGTRLIDNALVDHDATGHAAAHLVSRYACERA